MSQQRLHSKEVSSFASQAATPPAAVSLKPFLRELSQDRNKNSTNNKNNTGTLSSNLRQYEEVHERRAPSNASKNRLGATNELHSISAHSGSQVRPGTSMFYEPSGAKPETDTRQPINELEQVLAEEKKLRWQAEQANEQLLKFPYNNPQSEPEPSSTHQKRSRSSPACHGMSHPYRQQVFNGREDPSFGSFHQDFSYGQAERPVNMNEQSSMMRDKRSVQVPNPENRVLFELTTISNEIGKDNMTTVQTTLIPNSIRSQKQLGPHQAAKHMRRGSSEQAYKYKTQQEHETVKVSECPFAMNGTSESQNLLKEPQVQSQNAYREIVMNQTRRHVGMTRNETEIPVASSHMHDFLTSDKRQSDYNGLYQYKTTASALTISHPQQLRSNGQERSSQEGERHPYHREKQRAHSTHSHQRRGNQQQQSSPYISTSYARNCEQGYNNTGQQYCLSSATENEGLQLNGDRRLNQMTPGGYENTTDQAYTYSMYTETIRGGQDNSNTNPGQKSRAPAGLQSIGTSAYIISGQNDVEAGERMMTLSQREFLLENGGDDFNQLEGEFRPRELSPEREQLGYDTAMFARHQLKQLANGTGTVVSDNYTKQSARQAPSNHSVSSKKVNHKKSSQSKGPNQHVHSDSIMSAQFHQAESVHQIMSQENLLQDRPQYQKMMEEAKQFLNNQQPQPQFSARNAGEYEERRHVNRLNQARQARGFQAAAQIGPCGIGGIESVRSVDRKTFTLGEKGPNGVFSGQGAVTSKTDRNSNYFNLITSPTDQFITSATVNLQNKPTINPVTQLMDIEKQTSQQVEQQRDVHSTNRDNLRDTIDGCSVSPRMLQTNQTQTTTHKTVQMPRAIHHQQIPQQKFSQTTGQFDFPLSQPYQINSHRPYHGSANQQRSSSNPQMLAAIISDPSISFPSQSKLVGHQTSTSQLASRTGNTHYMSSQFAVDNLAGISTIRTQQVNPILSQQQQNHHACNSLNTQRASRVQQCELSISDQPIGFDLTPLSHRANANALNGQNQSTLSDHNGAGFQAASRMMGELNHNMSQVTTATMVNSNNATILKQEILLLRKQLNDARNSNLFLKKQTLQLQHTINMQEIQIGQLEEQVAGKDHGQEQDQAQMSHLRAQYLEQKSLADALMTKASESEELYQQRIAMFNDELELMKSERMKSGYRIGANVMQLSNAMQHLTEIVGDQNHLTPFLGHFQKVCQTLRAQVGAMTQSTDRDLDEHQKQQQYDSRHQLKMMKRTHNFEKFRKEIRNLCKNHYRIRIHERDIELEKALKHIKSQERQIQKLSQVAQSMRASYEQSQENIRSLTFENRSLMQTFDQERLRLEKLHFQEIARLHRAVKSMKAKTISTFATNEAEATQQTCRSRETLPNQECEYEKSGDKQRTQEDQETINSESEALTTIDQCQQEYFVPAKREEAVPQSPKLLQSAHSQNQADAAEEKQLLILQNQQFRQTLEGQNILIQELQKALIYNQELHKKEHENREFELQMLQKQQKEEEAARRYQLQLMNYHNTTTLGDENQTLDQGAARYHQQSFSYQHTPSGEANQSNYMLQGLFYRGPDEHQYAVSADNIPMQSCQDQQTKYLAMHHGSFEPHEGEDDQAHLLSNFSNNEQENQVINELSEEYHCSRAKEQITVDSNPVSKRLADPDSAKGEDGIALSKILNFRELQYWSSQQDCVQEPTYQSQTFQSNCDREGSAHIYHQQQVDQSNTSSGATTAIAKVPSLI